MTLRVAVSVVLCAAFSPAAFSQGPTGGIVRGGEGRIVTPDDATTRIEQSSQNLALDWQTFNVAAGHTVEFVQPNAQSTALNRIHDQNASQIFGAIIANGNVFLVNPNGIVFGETGSVNVNSLLATTLDVTPEDFMSGNWDFQQAAGGSDGMVVNRGLIQAAQAGSVALVAGAVSNEGVILADYGQVTLAGATRTYVDFDGDGLLRFEVSGEIQTNPNGVDAAVHNSGTIQANGGQVLLTAQAVDAIFRSAVNHEGVISATRVERVGGVVRLGGGDGTTMVAGTIDASSADDVGGTVEITGDRVGLMDGATIDASGATGGGQVNVGGGFQGNDENIQNATVTYVAETATINADATDNGDGGEVIVWADDTTRFNGTISARGGDNGGDGGFVEVSGSGHLTYAGTTDVRAPLGSMGTLLLDPKDITIVNAAVGVVGDAAFATDPTATLAIAPADLVTALDGANVVLQANNDITVTDAVDSSGNTGIGDLSLQAGRSILINADVTLRGAFTAVANHALADPVNRDAGDAVFTMAGATTIDTSDQNGAISITYGVGPNGTDETGTMTVVALNAGTGAITLNTTANEAGASVEPVSVIGALTGNSLTSTGSDFTNTAAISTAGSLDLNGHTGALNIDANITTGGGLFTATGGMTFDSSGFTIATTGDAGLDGGFVTITTAGALTTGAIDSQAGAAVANGGSGGAITLNAGATLTVGSLNTSGTAAFGGSEAVGGLGRAITLTGTGITLNGDLTAAGGAGDGAGAAGNGGDITLNGPATLNTATVTISTGTTSGNVHFTSTVDSAASQYHALAITAGTGSVSFGAAVGTGVDGALGSLTIGSASLVTLNGSVTTAGLQSYAAPVVLNTDGIVLTTTANGANGALTFSGAVTSPASSWHTLQAIAGSGEVSFGGDVGGAIGDTTLRLGELDVSSSVPVQLGASIRLDNAGNNPDLILPAVNITVPVTLSTANGTASVGAVTATGDPDLSLAGGGTTTFSSTLDIGAGTLNTTGVTGGTTTVTGALTAGSITTAAAAYSLVFQGGGTVSGGTATTFSNTTGLSIGADFAFLAGLITSSGPPLTVTADTRITANDGNVITLGNVTINDTFTLRLGADTAVGNAISVGTVNGTVAGTSSLIINSTSTVNLNGIIGGSFALNEIQAQGGTVNLGADVTTSGALGRQRYYGATVLTESVTLTAGGAVSFATDESTPGGSLNSEATEANTLTIAAGGVVSFSGPVGQGTNGALGSIAVSGAGTTDVFGVAITTTGAQTYSNNVRLDTGAATFNSTAAGDVTFGGTVSGVASARDFTVVNSDGAVTASGAIGTNIGAVSITGTTVSLQAVTSASAQAYTGTTTLNDDLSATAGGITFNSGIVVGAATAVTTGAGITIGAVDATTDTISFRVDDDNNSAETLTVGGAFTNTANITLAGGTDTNDILAGPNTANAWTITAADTGTLNSVGFSNFSNLTGGTDTDSFVFSVSATLAGTIIGGAGSDTLDFGLEPFSTNVALTASAADGYSGTASAVGGFTTIDVVIGGSNTNLLTGLNAVAAWATSAADAGTYESDGNTLTFSNFTNWTGGTDADTFALGNDLGTVTGGDGADVFNVNASIDADLAGGAGADSFVFADNSVLTGTIDGGADNDTLSLAAYAGATDVTLTASTATGYSGTTAAVSGGFSNVDVLTGGAGTNTLTGLDAVATWATTDANDGTYLSSANTLTFNAFANWTGGTDADTFTLGHGLGTVTGGDGADVFNVNASIAATLVGGAGADQFNFADTAALTGSIDGGDNSDTLNASAYASAVTFTLASVGGSGGATGTTAGATNPISGGFSNINVINGGSDADVFNVNASVTANLSGNAGDDTFVFGDVLLTGTIDGGADSDSLDLAAVTTATSATLTAGSATGFTGTTSAITVNFSNIDVLTGSSTNTNTLTGLNAAAAWTTSAANAGSYVSSFTLAFNNFANWTGGSQADTFNLGDSLGTVNGGANNDAFNITASIAATLVGDTGDDTFTFSNGAELTGTIDGGSESDTLNVSAYSTAVTFTLESGAGGADGTTTGGTNPISGGFSGIDSFVGTNAGNTFNITESLTLNLTGGTGADSFVFTNGAILTGSIDGGDGSDTLDVSAYLTAVDMTITSDGVTNGLNVTTAGATNPVSGSISNIDVLTGAGVAGSTLIGSANADTFLTSGTDAGTITHAGSNSATYSGFDELDGAGGANVFNLGHDVTGSVSGGADIDTFNVTASIDADLIGGAGIDVFALANNTLTGSIAGGADGGSITGIGSALLTAAGATGFNGESANVTGDFTDITNLAGTGTLTGLDAVSAWSALTGSTGTYTSTNALTFSGFVTLQGGSDVDTFTLTGSASYNLNGGAGVDVFALGGNALFAAIGGQADGGSVTGFTSASLASAGGLVGFTGTTPGATGGFSNITSLTGSGTLTGLDTVSTWSALTGTTGTYTDTVSGNSLAFNDFATLQGGTAVDTFTLTGNATFNLVGGEENDSFVFGNGHVLTGTIDGGLDDDTLNLGAYTTVTDVTLTTAAGNGYSGTTDAVSAGFSNINVLTGGNQPNTLTGRNAAATWTTTAANAGTYLTGGNELAFSAFTNWTGGSGIDTFHLDNALGTVSGGDAADEFNVTASITANLAGGAGTDSFVFANSAVLTGSIDGGADSDTLSLAAYAAATDVTLSASTANGYSGTTGAISVSFANIDVLTGGSDTNTLTGLNAAADWTTTAANNGTYESGVNTLTFNDFANWTGGSQADTFNLGDSLGTVNGGANGDAFNITASISAALVGGSGSDTFTFTNGAVLTGSIDGGTESDTLDVSAYASALTFTLGIGAPDGSDGTTAGATNPITGSFSGIDAFVGTNAGNTFNITQNLTLNLTGGTGADNFVFSNAAILTGSIDGLAGSDTLDVSAYSTAVDMTITGNGTGNGLAGDTAVATLGFDNINVLTGAGVAGSTLIGSAAADTFTTSGADAGEVIYDGGNAATYSGFDELDGAGGADVFYLAHDVTGSVSGGADVDTFNVTASIDADLIGGAGIDVFALNANTLTGSIAGGADGGSITGIGSVVLTAAGGAAGFDGESANITGDFTDITSLDGGGTLTGLDTVSTWSALTGSTGTYTDTVSSRALTFSDFAILQGGSAIDTFTLTGPATLSLYGGGDVDVFALATHTLSGAIAGGAAGGSITGIGSATLTGVGGNAGFNGTSASVGNNFTDITNLDGTGTLAGTDTTNTWTLDGAPTFNDGANTLGFSGFATLTGGTGVDTFNVTVTSTFGINGGDGADVFDIDAALTGSVAGGAGADTLQGALVVNATLTSSDPDGFTGTADGVSGFSGIDTVTGNGGTLTGDDAPNTWALNGTPTYSNGANTLNFSGFATLTGGTGIDTFNVTAASAFNLNGGAGADVFDIDAALTGSVAGGADADTLQGDQVVNATLTGASAEGFSGNAGGVSGFSGVATLIGNAGTLTGQTGTNIWALDGTPTYTNGANILNFSGFATLTGGAGIDTFNVTAASTFNLNGGDGADSFVFGNGAVLTGSIDGGAGSDTLDVTAYATSVTFNLNGEGTDNGIVGTTGGATNPITGSFDNINALVGTNAGNTFNVTQNLTLDLTGGTGADSFVFSNGVVLDGSIDGLAGSDTLSLGAYASVTNVSLTASTANGYAGTTAAVSDGFSNIDVLTGSSIAANTLTGLDAVADWATTAADAGTYTSGGNELTFTAFGTWVGGNNIDTFALAHSLTSVTGGNGADVFNVNTSISANLTGGAGADSFVFANSAVLTTGSVDGGADSDTLDLSAYTSATNVLLTGSTATGYSGNVVATPTFNNIDVLTGGSQPNTLTGLNAAATWTTTGANAGTYASGGNTLNFNDFANWTGGTGIDTFALGHDLGTVSGGDSADIFNMNASLTATALNGGAGADSFVFANTVVLTGLIDGGTDSDTLDVSAYATSVTFGLNGNGGVDGIVGTTTGAPNPISGGFDNINALVGTNAGNTFNITQSLTLDLTGGTGADSFVFSDGVILTGSIDGAAGIDTLSLAAYTSATDVTLTGASSGDGHAGTTAAVSAGFSNIHVLTGGSEPNTLTGLDIAARWETTAANSGYYEEAGFVMTINNFANWIGGSGVDTFELDHDLGTVTGGGGADVFNVNASIDADLIGGAGIDVFALASNTLTGSIAGGADGGSITGIGSALLTAAGTTGFNGTSANVTANFTDITNLAGSGTLTGSNTTNTWTLAGSPTFSDGTNTLAFSGFATLTGGTGVDTFNVTSASTFNLAGGDGADVFDIDAALDGSVAGGVGADTLQGDQVVNASLTSSVADGYTGTADGVNGGFTGIGTLTGTGTLTGSNTTNTWALNGTPTFNDGANTLNFSGFATLTGGTDVDTFNVTAASTFDLDGGDGTDVFDIDAALTGSVAAGTGHDVLQGDLVVNATISGTAFDGAAGTAGGVTGFSGIDVLTGNGGTLTGADTNITWTLDGTPVHDDGDAPVFFSGFATLQGGTGIDTFNVTAASTFDLNGGDGADVFDIDAALTGSVAGGTGADTLQGDLVVSAALTSADANGFTGTAGGVSGFSGIDTLTGNAGTLTGSNSTNTWALDGTPTFNDGTNTLNFTGFATLTGGTGADTFDVTAASTFGLNGGDGADSFVFGDGVILTGVINGGADSDTLNLSAYASALTFDLAAAGTDGANGHVGGATDPLTGAFSNLNVFSGGTAGDTFNVDASVSASLSGNAGADSFVFDDTVVLTGTIDGGADSDTLNVSAYTTAIDMTITGGGATDGLAGTSSVATAGFTNINVLTGAGVAGSTLIGSAAADTFTTSGIDAGEVIYDGGNAATYSGFDELDGAGGADVFNLTHDVTGSVSGGADVDTFNVTASIDADLIGGAGIDVFALNANTLTGSITGGADGGSITGIGSVVLTAAGGAAGFDGESANITGDFTDITSLDGGGILTGIDTVSAWSALTGSTGTYTDTVTGRALTFTDFATLQGGSAVDTFTLTGAASFAMNGGADVDVFNLAANTLTGAIAGEANGGSISGILGATLSAAGGTIGFDGSTTQVTGNFTDITSLTGTGTLTGLNTAGAWSALTGTTGTYTNGATATFSGFGTLQGGTLVDTFTLTGNATFNLSGGAGVDVFTLAGNTLTGTIAGEVAGGTISGVTSATLTGLGGNAGFNGTTTNSGNFTDITSLTGTGAGTLTGMNAGATWTTTGANSGSYLSGNTLTFFAFPNWTGGTGDDTFNLSAGVTSITGGAGTDTVAITGTFTHAGTLTLDVESVTDVGGFLLTVTNLVINNASSGIGADGAYLTTNADRIDISASGATFISESDSVEIGTLDLTGGLTLNANGTVRFLGNATTIGAQSVNAATIQTNGTHTTNGGAVDFDGNFELQAATTLDAGAGAIDIIGSTTGAFALTANSTGVTTFGTVDVGSLTTNAGGSTVLNGNVTTSGSQTFGDAVTLGTSITATGAVIFNAALTGGDNALTISGDLDLNAAATGLSALSVSGASDLGADVTTTGAQTYSGATTLSGGDRTLTGSTMTFGSTLAGGDNALTVAGNFDLDGAATGLASLSVSGTSALSADVTTSGNQSYAGTVAMSGDRSFSGSTIAFSAGVTGDASLSVAATTAHFGGAVTTTGAQSITASTIQTNGAHTTSDADLLFSGNLVAQSATTLNSGSGAGNITVTGTTDGAGALTLAAGTGSIDLQGAVGSNTALASLTVNSAAVARFGVGIITGGAQSISASDIRLNGTLQTTDAAITLAGATTLETATVLNGGAGVLSLQSVGGGNNLTLQSSGGAVFNGAVAVPTLGLGQLTGPVTIAGATTITTGGTAVDFSPAAGIEGAGALSINVGSATITLPTTGASTALESLTLVGGQLNLVTVATSGFQDYSGPVSMTGTLSAGGSTTFRNAVTLIGATTVASPSVTFDGSVNGAHALTVDAGSGDVFFNAGVGDQVALLSLSVTGGNNSIHVTDGAATTGAQTYTGRSVINGDFTGSALTFAGVLQVDAGSTAVLNADTVNLNGGANSVTGSGALSIAPATTGASIGIGDADSTLNLSGSALSGYNGNLTIGSTSASDAPIVGGGITIGESLSLTADASLNLFAGTGDIVLNAGVVEAGTLVMIAANGSILNNAGVDGIFRADSAIVIASDRLGADIGEELNFQKLSAGTGAPIELALGGAESFVNEHPTITRLDGPLATNAGALAQNLNINTNANAINRNAGQDAASREQGGGVSESGAIDSSLFEQISLWAVEQGLLLPRDQREDYEELEECDAESGDCEGVLTQALSNPGQVAVVGGCCSA